MSFARIRSKGDVALFGGLTTQDMKNKLGVPENRPLADFLPTITIKAKDFANEITPRSCRKLQRSRFQQPDPRSLQNPPSATWGFARRRAGKDFPPSFITPMTRDQLKKPERDLWAAADKLRANSDLKASEYSTPVLGLIFLKFADNKYRQHEDAILAEYSQLKGTRRERSLQDMPLRSVASHPARLRAMTTC